MVSQSCVVSLVPASLVDTVLSKTRLWEQREKKINTQAPVGVLIGMTLDADRNMPAVWHNDMDGQRQIGEHLKSQVPMVSAMSQNHQHLNMEPIRELGAQMVLALATADLCQ